MTATASSTKGTKVCVLKGTPTGSSLTPTAITKAKPAVVSIAAVTGLTVGDLVKFPAAGAAGATGFTTLDGKSFPIASIDATAKTFTLAGSDTTGETATLAATPSATAYPSASDMLCLCLSSITFNPGQANTISVATFCDPTASLPSQVVEAGNVEIAGYVDITDPGYLELMAAQADGKSRTWRITLGNAQGYVLFDGILSTLSMEIPIDGAVAYAGTITLSSAYRHLF